MIHSKRQEPTFLTDLARSLVLVWKRKHYFIAKFHD